MTTANAYIQDFFPPQRYKWKKTKLFSSKKDTSSEVGKESNEIKINFFYSDKTILKTNISIEPIKDHLRAKTISVPFPVKWRLEGISPPTIKCKEITLNVVLKLYDDFFLIPDRVSSSIEEGIFLKYIDYLSGNYLSIEIYNDLDIAAIITNGDKIIKAIDIYNDNFDEAIKIFKK